MAPPNAQAIRSTRRRGRRGAAPARQQDAGWRSEPGLHGPSRSSGGTSGRFRPSRQPLGCPVALHALDADGYANLTQPSTLSIHHRFHRSSLSTATTGPSRRRCRCARRGALLRLGRQDRRDACTAAFLPRRCAEVRVAPAQGRHRVVRSRGRFKRGEVEISEATDSICQ